MDLEEALDNVFAAPLEEFTQTRNAVAKELKGEAAKTVKELKKPNLAAWAVNQLARKHADEIAALFDVTNKLRVAQRRVLSGGKASDLRKATDERNKIVAILTKLAERILEDAGHSASSPTLAGVNDSLIAVASDETGAELLRIGRLTRELEPSSVLDVSGLTLVESLDDSDDADEAAPERDASAVQDARRVLGEARNTLKAARDEFKKANAHAQKVTRESDEAERKAKAAHEAAEFARRAAEARNAEVEEAEKAAEAAQRDLDELDS